MIDKILGGVNHQTADRGDDLSDCPPTIGNDRHTVHHRLVDRQWLRFVHIPGREKQHIDFAEEGRLILPVLWPHIIYRPQSGQALPDPSFNFRILKRTGKNASNRNTDRLQLLGDRQETQIHPSLPAMFPRNPIFANA